MSNLENVVYLDFDDDIDAEFDNHVRHSRTPYSRGYDRYEEGQKAHESKVTVHQLDSLEEIDRLVGYFLDKDQLQNALMVVLGLNTGMRPSDLLECRWKVLFSGDTPLTEAVIAEGKTGKTRKLYFNKAVIEAAKLRRKQLGNDYVANNYIFTSPSPRKGHVHQDWRNLPPDQRVYNIDVMPIHVRSMTRIIRTAAKAVGLYTKDRPIAAYSLRKTAMNAPLGLVDGVSRHPDLKEMIDALHIAQAIGNHGNIAITMNHYVSLKKKILEETYKSMNLGLGAIEAYKSKKGAY